MAPKITHELLVCTCCAAAVQYAESCNCPADNHPSGVASFVGIESGQPVVLIREDEDDSINFMDRACDGCDSTLAGDREQVVIID